MADPYGQNKSGVYSVDTPHSAIDDLIATNDLKQFSDSDKNRLYEFLFGPQDMELDMGFAPDLALSPLISKKGIMSTLKNLFGKNKSKSKFPVGYGELTRESATSSSYDDAVQTLRDLNLKGQVPKPATNPVLDKIQKLDESTRKKLSEAKLSTTLPEKQFDWSKEEWQKFSDITGIPLEELTGKIVPWSEPLW